MEKTNLGVIILIGISVVGIIVLSALSKTADILTPIVTALLGFLAGNNKDTIVSMFKKR